MKFHVHVNCMFVSLFVCLFVFKPLRSQILLSVKNLILHLRRIFQIIINPDV